MRKRERKHQELQGLIKDGGAPQKVIYVDNKIVLENNLSNEDLLKMADMPSKFHLSHYLRNKVRRLRNAESLDEEDQGVSEEWINLRQVSIK